MTSWCRGGPLVSPWEQGLLAPCKKFNINYHLYEPLRKKTCRHGFCSALQKGLRTHKVCKIYKIIIVILP